MCCVAFLCVLTPPLVHDQEEWTKAHRALSSCFQLEWPNLQPIRNAVGVTPLSLRIPIGGRLTHMLLIAMGTGDMLALVGRERLR